MNNIVIARLGKKAHINQEPLDIGMGIRFYVDGTNYFEVKPDENHPEDLSIRVSDGSINIIPECSNVVRIKARRW